eukprot:scaffold8661_cov78-Skeletonema_dohrnii-CCMP3373.AAC.3
MCKPISGLNACACSLSFSSTSTYKCTSVRKRSPTTTKNDEASFSLSSVSAQRETDRSSFTITTSSNHTFVAFADLYDLRKRLQTIEFIMNWVIVLCMVGTDISTTLPVLYVKMSAFTRCLAYAVDFANAYIKLNTVPMWLVLHHSGVLLMHISEAFFLTPATNLQVIRFALASQSSHNTWTKKHSLALYWGNVLLGFLAGSSVHVSHEETSAAASCYFLSLFVTGLGISLLVWDTLNSQLSKFPTNGSGRCS